MRFLRAAIAALSLATSIGIAEELHIGDAAGPIKLITLTGEQIDMTNYAERKATVILFLSGRSEDTLRVIEQINQLNSAYRERDILFVGICSNAEESGEELRLFAQRRGIIFPIYRDNGKAIADRFGAKYVPEVFVLDHEGKLAFHGGFQDEAARKAFEVALRHLLRNQPIEISTHAVIGTPIDAVGTKRELDDPYGTISFSSELLFEKIPKAVAFHCSTICEAENHDLLSLWYGGTYESAHDQSLYLSRRKAGERNWSPPRIIHEDPLQPPGNGVIFRDVDNQIAIVWGRMEGTRPMGRGQGWDRCRLFIRKSEDNGETWSEDQPLFDETRWCVPRNPPIVLGNGTLLLPVEGIENGVDGSDFLVRAAVDKPWQKAGFTPKGSQPAVIQRNDGSLLALLRHPLWITEITSKDDGKTWTPPIATKLRNPDSGITMTKLANGHLVLVYNDAIVARTPLSITRSLDEGKTWEKPLHLESNPGEYSYPCIIQSTDGFIHVTYTFRRYAIKHVQFNEEWMTHFERSD